MALPSIAPGVALVVLVSGPLACAVAGEGPPPLASAEELRMRAARPAGVGEVEEVDAPAECARALARVDDRIAHDDLAGAERLSIDARETCGPGYGVDWRRGWIARARGDFDGAARAYLRELDGPAPAGATGAQLLDVLPRAKASTRRKAARIGGEPIVAGFEGVDHERLVALRCNGRPAVLLRIACNRDPPSCEYRYRCANGLVRDIVVGSGDEWFVTAP